MNSCQQNGTGLFDTNQPGIIPTWYQSIYKSVFYLFVRAIFLYRFPYRILSVLLIGNDIGTYIGFHVINPYRIP